MSKWGYDMAKLTQCGRMKRRIKRELDAARGERIKAIAQTGSLLAAAYAQIEVIKNTIITTKMLAAWKKQNYDLRTPK
jgi:hypothetical protein